MADQTNKNSQSGGAQKIWGSSTLGENLRSLDDGLGLRFGPRDCNSGRHLKDLSNTDVTANTPLGVKMSVCLRFERDFGSARAPETWSTAEC